MVGNVPVGGDAPVTVQTMTNTPTSDPVATIDQIRRCEEAGADIIRVSCPDTDSTAALANHGHRIWNWRNQNLQSWAMTVVLFAAITAAFGPAALPFLILQAIYAISLLETVNYLEHYGLARQKMANGRYEPCRPVHSWNSNHIISNVFLYHLQRHSDHHAHPRRRYQTLRHFDESPQLPGGYATMILLAYAPPLWRRVMDPRVAAHYSGNLDLAAIQPGRRAAVEAGLRRRG